MPWCPNERTEYREGFTVCADCGAPLVAELPPAGVAPDATKDSGGDHEGAAVASLGPFERLRVPILSELLAEHGIVVTTDEPDAGPYTRSVSPNLQKVFVPAERAEEARRLIADVLPGRVEEIVSLTASDETFAERGSLDARDAGPLVPFGFMEPAVAAAFVEVMGEEDIACEPEYPLDRPAPAYARADGRVRMHVEEWFLEPAAELLEGRVRTLLRARMIPVAEPLLAEGE